MNINDNEIVFDQGLSIIFYEVNIENPAPYNQTAFWLNAQYYLKFIKDEKDGRKETLIPGRGKLEEFKKSFDNLKRKLAENHPLQTTDVKFLPAPAGFQFPLVLNADKSSELPFDSFSQNSLDSISSQQSSENSSESKPPNSLNQKQKITINHKSPYSLNQESKIHSFPLLELRRGKKRDFIAENIQAVKEEKAVKIKPRI